MFTRAVRAATDFTYPCIGLRRRNSGETYSTIGAFVVLNAAGWVVTSAHLVEEIVAIQREVSTGEVPTGADPSNACVEHAELWALPEFATTRPQFAEMIVRPIADLALARLEPFDASRLGGFPVLRDTARHPIEAGLSVCRLGYPFHNIAAEWDEQAGEFKLPAGAFPVPAFALDGIVARFHRIGASGAPGDATFIETSTPGLRGQSGGPLLDVKGRVCGIQSHTTHLDLGFDARFSAGDQIAVERQFLNVGAASHVAELVAMAEEAGIAFKRG